MVDRAGSSTAGTINAYSAAEAGRPPGPAPIASSNPPPNEVPAIGSDAGPVERAQSGTLPMRDGENYAQCVMRFRKNGENNYRWDAAAAGCATGLLGGATAGLAIGGALAAKSGGSGAAFAPSLVVGSALVGCGLGAYAKYKEAGPAGASAGEAEGRLACDGLPGSPSNPAQPPAAKATSPKAAAPSASASAPPVASAAPSPAASAPPPAASAPPPAAPSAPPQTSAPTGAGCVEDQSSGMSVCR